ncbi:MAG TPA: 16S rRNA (guanine(966)-N(2))-methyltransferase RsmD [Nitrospiria bacterium]|nr:16S rRNA (guanine(966)-N(2))-methyltransferase RsmD [Nitrospiria bacterium]
MRIIGGTARGRKLKTARIPGIRPTADRVREALFNILRNRVEGARVLDLFSGFGGVGLEALSRGARRVEFVESNEQAVKILEANLSTCGFSDRAVVHKKDVFRFLKGSPGVFDWAWADPPYHTQTIRKLLPAVGRGDIISADGLFILEHFTKARLVNEIEGLELSRSYRYGETRLTLYERKKADK